MPKDTQLHSILYRRLYKKFNLLSSITGISAFDLANNDALIAENSAGTANVDLIKLSTANAPVAPNGLWAASGYKIGHIATVTTANTAGDITWTAAQIISGTILRDCNGGDRADLFPTAANIIAAIPGATTGMYFDVHIRNTGSNTITMTTADGLTLSGTMTIATLNAKDFRVVITAATTVTIYSLGTVTF